MPDRGPPAGIVIWWDVADARCQGWAFRATWPDGHEESGPLDDNRADDAGRITAHIAEVKRRLGVVCAGQWSCATDGAVVWTPDLEET